MENKYFRFNLLPKKTKEEIELIEERDNSLFYSVGLVLFSAFIWLTTALFMTFVMVPRVSANRQASTNINQQIASFAQVRLNHGELVYKSGLFQPLLARKIDTDLIFEIAEGLTASENGANVKSYSRELTGKFVFSVTTANYSGVANIMDNAPVNLAGKVTDLELRSATLDADRNIVVSSIALNINGIAITDEFN